MAYNQNSPFESVTVDWLRRSQNTVFWELEEDFQEQTPYVFTLQWARSGDSSWTTVTSVTDTYYATDPTVRERGALFEGAYRVKLVTAEETIYYSLPSRLPSQWVDADFRFAAEIKRRELLTYAPRFGGIEFWLLLRKNYGTPCTSCLDTISGEVNVYRCPVCYGTGYVGGYHTPYLTTGRLVAPKASQMQQTDTLGTAYKSVRVIRFCPLPVVHEYDYVVMAGTDERLQVLRVETVAEIKGIPIIQHLHCAAVPTSDSIYDLVLGGVTGGSPTGSDSDWN